MSIGKRITQLFDCFLEKNIVKNKQDFCYKMGIDYTHYSKYATDKINFSINADNIGKIIAMNVNINWLLTGQGEMFINGTGPAADQEEKVRIEELEKEIERLKKQLEELPALKKSVADLEKENNELAKELLEKYRELTKIKGNLGLSST